MLTADDKNLLPFVFFTNPIDEFCRSYLFMTNHEGPSSVAKGRAAALRERAPS
jgi:hypothetical protein